MLPKGEKLKRAINWVTETKKDFPGKEVMGIINEANMRFDLDPKDSQFLINFFKEQAKE